MDKLIDCLLMALIVFIFSVFGVAFCDIYKAHVKPPVNALEVKEACLHGYAYVVDQNGSSALTDRNGDLIKCEGKRE